MCLSVLPATLVCTDARSEWRPEEGVRYPGAGATGNCEQELKGLGWNITFSLLTHQAVIVRYLAHALPPL